MGSEHTAFRADCEKLPKRAVFRSTLVRLTAVATLWSLSALAPPLWSEYRIQTVDPPAELEIDWRFRTGDSLAWAHPDHEDQAWDEINVPGSFGKQGYTGYSGIAWYRLTLRSPPDLTNSIRSGDAPIALQMGSVESAYEVYAGGRLIGKVGEVAPEPQPRWDEHALHTVPGSALDDSGRLVIALRVWKSPHALAREGGPHSEVPILGDPSVLARTQLLNQLPALVLFITLALIAIQHLLLYGLRPQLAEYMWFALFCLVTAVYVLLSSQWKTLLGTDFVLLENAEYFCLFLLPAVGIEIFCRFFEYRRASWVKASQVVFVLWAFVVGLTQSLRPNLLSASAFYAAGSLVIAGMTGTLIVKSRQGDARARRLLLAFLLLLVAAANDAALERELISSVPLLGFALGVVVALLTIELASRFRKIHVELDSLNRELEQRVRKQTEQLNLRTSELVEKNEELERNEAQLKEVSVVDSLTGLRNRRFFRENIRTDVAQTNRLHHPPGGPVPAVAGNDLIFLLIDVDHFKQVNDSFGHRGGDEILVQFAELLRNTSRDSDVLIRWGGEEFLVVNRFSKRSRAHEAAQRILSAVSNHSFTLPEEPDLRLTCSIGYACLPFLESLPTAFGADEVIDLADRALYLAKREGRNRAVGVMANEQARSELLYERIRDDLVAAAQRGDVILGRTNDRPPMREAARASASQLAADRPGDEARHD